VLEDKWKLCALRYRLNVFSLFPTSLTVSWHLAEEWACISFGSSTAAIMDMVRFGKCFKRSEHAMEQNVGEIS
jgi:hypothetical protein